MNYLIVLVLLYLSIMSSFADVKISEFAVVCDPSPQCSYYSEKIKALNQSFRSDTHLQKTLRLIFTNGGVKNVRINRQNERLVVSFSVKKLINDIYFDIKDKHLRDLVQQNMRLERGAYLEEAELNQEVLRVEEILKGKGYFSTKIQVTHSDFKEGLKISFKISGFTVVKIAEIQVRSSPLMRLLAYPSLKDLSGKNFDLTQIRLKLDDVERILFDYGYYLVNLNYRYEIKNNMAFLDIAISDDQLFQFSIMEDKLDAKFEYIGMMKDLFKRYKKLPDFALIDAQIRDYLKAQSYLNPIVRISEKKIKNKSQEEIKQTVINIDKGYRTKISKIVIKGNKYKTTKEIRKLYYSFATDLAVNDYLDYGYLELYRNLLKTEYIKAGFVACDIAIPKVKISKDFKRAEVEVDILEGPEVRVESITIQGMDYRYKNSLLEMMKTQVNSPFNPLDLEQDLVFLLNDLREKGYFNAEITNLDSDEIVQYSKNKSQVFILIKVKQGKWINLGNFIIVGNKKTKESAIRKRLMLKNQDPITPSSLKLIENNLSTTGLFNSVKLKPVHHTARTSQTDVIVELEEKDYGLIEIAPGFRTDLGVKLSAQFNYLNLGGLNKGISLKAQVNRRVDHQSFDRRRQEEGKHLLEYSLSTQFNQADILNTSIEHAASLTFQRRRFFDLDADIARVNNTFSRDLTSKLAASIRHQYESINQFDATNLRDNGSFEIGAMTPSLTADFRNNRINPTSGAFFNVSCEFANKYFLSQEKDDLKINFYKLISRNRFYIPFSRGTIAISMVGGIQENLATAPLKKNGQVVNDTNGEPLAEGYIPSIKVFRLTGTDIVRGFSDEEINLLPSGTDIGRDRVENRAYMANFKFEPRYFINDNMITGVFFDAGRVYVDQFDLREMRQSVGLTLKFLTPVGTLDFDYGIKLLRKRLEGGRLESPGRFHVSIGFF